LLFAAGARPSASDVARLLATSAPGGQAATVSHRPSDDHGWLELLASGLTFDLRGLAPSVAAPMPAVGHVYGLPADIAKFDFEAISLAPGQHVAAGANLMPVIRTLIGLAANLALQLPITAICWNPAQSWMEPKYFGRVVVSWLSGGPFPVLGLTGVHRLPDGVLESSGLAFFTGQELRVPEREGEPGSETVRLAARLIDRLVQHGRLDKAEEMIGIGGEQLVAQPTADGRHISVSRGE
jgi:hypothetical protein